MMKSVLWFLVIVSGFIPVSNGFLLDSTTPGSKLGSSVISDQHFLTLIELLSDEKQHRYALEKKIATLEQTVATIHPDNKVDELERYVKQLESRLYAVEKTVALHKNETCVCSDNELRFKLNNVTENWNNTYIDLGQKYSDLKTTTIIQNQRFKSIENTISGLSQIKAINQIQTLQSLQSDVSSLQTQTNQLLRNSKARGQDFVALYNRTLTVEGHFLNMSKQIKEDLTDTNKTLFFELSNQTRELQFQQNNIKLDLLTQISQNSIKVVISACITQDKDLSYGEVIKFDYLKESTGVSTLDKFKSTGKFTCEYPGVYIVAVNVMCHSSGGCAFYIYKNSINMVREYDYSTNTEHSISATTSLNLSANDIVSVQTGASFRARNYGTCISITKIK